MFALITMCAGGVRRMIARCMKGTVEWLPGALRVCRLYIECASRGKWSGYKVHTCIQHTWRVCGGL